MSLVSDRPFDALTEDSWVVPSSANIAIVADAAAPRSAPNVLRVTYPKGMAGGDEPTVMERAVPAPAKTVYLTFWMKVSSNFVGAGTNQLFYFWVGGTNRAVLSMQGSGTGTLKPRVSLRNVLNHGGTTTLGANVTGSAQVTRGKWQQWELAMSVNSAGNADGTVEWWIDGAKVGSYSDIKFVGASEGHDWETMKLDPVWVGNRSSVPAAQTISFDHLTTSAGSPSTGGVTQTVASIQVQPTATVQVGQTVQLTATPLDAAGNPVSGQTIAWASSNPAIATVSASGLVTGVAAGSANITASSGGQTGTTAVTVTSTTVSVASVSISAPSASLTIGQSEQLTATAYDAGGNAISGRTVTWSSSNSAIASVTSAGVVTGVAAGSATITATVDGVPGTTTITVTTVPVASVTLSPASASVNVGSTVQLTATLRDASGNTLTGRTVTWSSSNNGVASVSSSGLVTGVATGSATITATSGGVSGTSSITVTQAPVASVTVTLNSSTLSPGESTQATATLRDANGNVLTGRAVAWASSNTAVATVSGSGLVTAVAAGNANIIATAEGITGSAALTVSQPTSTGGTYANQPSGFTQITSTTLTSLTEDGWRPYYSIGLSSDASAPQDAPSVGQIRYPAGFAGGDSPGLLEHALPNTRQIYVSLWMKISSNWYGQLTGTNKVIHFWIGGQNRLFLNMGGVGTGTLQPEIGIQGAVIGNGNLPPNLAPSAQVKRGVWQHWEFVATANSSGTADGSITLWLDGVKVASYSGIEWTSTAAGWEDTKWDPTWGGLGGSVPADQYMWMDHIYISGR